MEWGGPKIDISKVEKRVGTNFVKKKPDLLKGTRILLENDPLKIKKQKPVAFVKQFLLGCL